MDPLVASEVRSSADEMSEMDLGQFVVGQVEGVETRGGERLGDLARLGPIGHLDADEHVGLLRVRDAVVELGHRSARPDDLAETSEAATTLRDRHGEHRFPLFADLGTLRHEPEAVEVHVGAAGHRHHRPGARVVGRPGLQPGDGEGPGRFENRTGVGEHVLDRRADRVGVDNDEVVDPSAGGLEGMCANELHRGAVGEQPDLVELDALTRRHRPGHRVGIDGLGAHDSDPGADGLHVGGDPGDQSAATDRYHDGVERAGVLAQDLHADRALPCDHVRIVERVDEREASLIHELACVAVAVRIGLAVEDDLGSASGHRVDFDFGGGRGHDNHGAAPQPLS